jgi:hypothetical protein
MVAAMAERFEVTTGTERELGEITEDVAPEAVLSEIEDRRPGAS